MRSSSATTRWLLRLALAAATLLAWALLNRSAAVFEIRPGLAFFFPAAAITVLAGAGLRWLGVVAVTLANFVLPWGAASDTLHQALFAAPGALWAALVALLPRARGATWVRLRRCLTFGLAGGSLLAALVGGALITGVGRSGGWSAFSATAALWWVSDFTAALVFGLPLLVLFVPDFLLDEGDLAAWREWRRQGREVGRTIALGITGGVALWALSRLLSVEVHWFVLLLLPAVVMASMGGGVGAGLVANGAVSVVYLGLVLVSLVPAEANLVVVLSSTYANLTLFVAFALLAGVMAGRNRLLVDHVRRQGEILTRGLEETVEALAAAMQTKVRTGLGHVARVAHLAVAVGRELGVSGEELAVLRRAAILHDVGKIGVPEAILNKASELEAQERALLEQHVEMGVEILERVEFLHPVLAIVRCHQERWDGSRTGPYPGHFGLRGEEIPFGARVLGVVEAFDAMTHDRPYRRPVSRNAAIAELWRCSGSQFDPAVVAALTRIIGQDLDRGQEEPAIPMRA